jgi:hypothetical protein
MCTWAKCSEFVETIEDLNEFRGDQVHDAVLLYLQLHLIDCAKCKKALNESGWRYMEYASYMND